MKSQLQSLKDMLSMARLKWNIRKGGAVGFVFRGRRYWINADQSAAYHVVNSTSKIATLADLLPRDAQTIFDVGGNCGLFSAFAEKSCPRASIHCFEPSQDLLPIIYRNVSSESVSVHGVAVGDCDDVVDLFVNTASQQTNSLNRSAVAPFSRPDQIETRKVDCITLDKFASDRNIGKVNVLKVDVQGNEGAVFRGAKRLLPSVDMVLVESTWLDIESIVALVPFALNYGFTHASVLNSVAYGADLLLSRQVMESPAIKLDFAINDAINSIRWH